MSASSSWRSSVIGGGGSRDITRQQVLENGMTGRQGETTKTLEDEFVGDKEWRTLYDDANDADDDVFIDHFTDDVNSMLGGIERSVLNYTRRTRTSPSSLSTHADRQSVDISVTVCFFVCNFVILYGYGFLRRG